MQKSEIVLSIILKVLISEIWILWKCELSLPRFIAATDLGGISPVGEGEAKLGLEKHVRMRPSSFLRLLDFYQIQEAGHRPYHKRS